MQIRSVPFLRLLGKSAWLLFALLAGWTSVFASHNLAGDITYNYIGPNTVEIVVTTYTDPSAALVDRCSIDIELWNSTGTVKITDLTGIPRQNGPFNNDPLFPLNCQNAQMGEYIIGNVKKNEYKVQYTFPGPGWYLVRYADLARLDDIINMAGSGSQAFFIETSILINPYIGEQNSPQFLNHPIDEACTGKLWTHNPGGYDPDGDSLVYTFVDCRQYSPPSIPSPITCTGFQMPDLINNNGPITIDSETGLITWDVPNVIGIYNIAYIIEEYRDGTRIGFAFRDMAIYVNPCDNNPPVIEAPTEICIYAGDTLQLDFTVYDPDFFPSQNPGDSIYFYLNNNGQNNNGPFAVPVSPANITITQPTGLQIPPDFPVAHDDTIKGTISWATVCDHIRPGFYQIDFYAHDNISYFADDRLLAANLITKVYVIPRPAEGLTAVAANREVTLNWTPHGCDSTRGYQIYRRNGGGWSQDTVCCDSDPEDQGYELIGTNMGQNSVTFVDDNNGQDFEFGVEYCYLVRAFFSDGVFSCTTEEVCVMIEKDFPVLIKDSVWVTDVSGGEMSVAWSQPQNIDPIFPQPYTYTLLRADDIDGTPVWNTISTNLPFDDTTFHDLGLNTVDRGYRYRVDLYDSNDELIVEGNNGSSIYLETTSGDQVLSLTWREFVPWTNRKYYIYRADDFTGPLVLIDSVNGNGGTQHSYLDRGLTNFEDYCYVVVSEGEYGEPSVPDSVRNASQRRCDIPSDLEPPCIGTIDFDTTRDCRTHTIVFDWTEPDSACGSDVDFYTIYFAETEGAPWVEIARVDSGVNFFSVPGLTTIADCYAITATDTNGNESQQVVYCFENCPEIELSNVFSPNNDGVNDYFSPIRDRNVRVTLVQIYDRWGSMVYSTNSVSNINQLWNGMNDKGKPVPDGVYYYLVRYEEDRLPSYVPKPPLAGHVTLLR